VGTEKLNIAAAQISTERIDQLAYNTELIAYVCVDKHDRLAGGPQRYATCPSRNFKGIVQRVARPFDLLTSTFSLQVFCVCTAAKFGAHAAFITVIKSSSSLSSSS